jgi:hypothetical protein
MPVRPRCPDTTKLGQKTVAWIGLEQPSQRFGTFGVRFGIELDDRDGELAVDEILGTSPRSDPPDVREVRGFSKRLLRKERWATAPLFGGGF